MSASTLEGRVALVTGANAGVGAAIAETLARGGAAVAIHYLGEPLPTPPDRTSEHEVAGPAAARDLVERITRNGGCAVAIAGDLAAPGTAETLFDEAEAELGPVGILVNNAAHCELPDTILDVTADGIDRHFRGSWPCREATPRRCLRPPSINILDRPASRMLRWMPREKSGPVSKDASADDRVLEEVASVRPVAAR